MPILHRATIGRGEKQHITLTEQLAEVVVKISGLFFIVGHHQEDFAGRLSYGTERNGGSRTAQPFHTDVRTMCRQALAQTKHTGMLIKKRQ